MQRSAAACLLLALTAGVPACHTLIPGPGNVESTASSGWIGRRVGCIDLHVAAAHDPVAPASATVLAFHFANSCGAEKAVDFTGLTGRAELSDGSSVKLGVYDPAREIRPGTLWAGGQGAEAIELDPPAGHGAPPLTGVRAVCVDVSKLAKDASAVSEACFRSGAAGLVPAETGVSLPPGSVSALPDREVSLTVGYRHFSRFGAGWDGSFDWTVTSSVEPLGHVPSDFDVAALQSGLLPARYRSGYLLSFGDTDTSGARSLGCLDVRVEAVMAHVAKSSVALAFMVGNRCAKAVRVALGRATVRASWAGAGERRMALYDPASEVHEPVIAPTADATELLEYLEPADAPAGPAQSVCVDVSRIDASERAVRDVPPICFTRTGRYANQFTIVGHQPFDAEKWAQASSFFHLFVETGASLNFVDPRMGGFATLPWRSTAPNMSQHDLATPAFKKTATLAWDLRYGWVLGHGYAGVMLRAGAAPIDSNVPVSLDGAPGRSDSALTDISVALLGGYVLTQSPQMRVRADLALGGRGLEVDGYTPGCSDSSCSWKLDTGWLLVEPRLAIDRWLSPRLSVSTTLSVDGLHLPNFGIGLSFAFHTWAYDGG